MSKWAISLFLLIAVLLMGLAIQKQFYGMSSDDLYVDRVVRAGEIVDVYRHIDSPNVFSVKVQQESDNVQHGFVVGNLGHQFKVGEKVEFKLCRRFDDAVQVAIITTAAGKEIYRHAGTCWDDK